MTSTLDGLKASPLETSQNITHRNDLRWSQSSLRAYLQGFILHYKENYGCKTWNGS